MRATATMLLLALAGCTSAEPTWAPCSEGDWMKMTASGYVIDCRLDQGKKVPKPKALGWRTLR